MNEIPALGAPVQALDHNVVDPMPILNQQRTITVAPPIPIPAPGKSFEQNEAPSHTGTKRNKQADLFKSPATDATAPTDMGKASTFPTSPGAAAIELAKRQRRQRVLVDMHNQHDIADDDMHNQLDIAGDIAHITQLAVENVYERKRLENIKRNQEIMRKMGLRQLAVEALENAFGSNQSSKPRRRAGPKKKKFSAGPRRSSARNRHQTGEYAVKTDMNGLLLQDGDDALDSSLDADFLLDLEDYFKVNNINASNAIKVDGHYRGWVSKDVAETYGLPLEYPGDDWIRSAGAAAASSTSTAGGSGKRGRKKGGRGGGSDAKTKSSASLSYNPNAYFYRHVAPHQRQAQGEWTQEEHNKFMEVVREWGVGDNWGLFASHICQRVGYQCSAFYRDVIIPSGAVIDDRFKMTRTGKAVFVR
jgi:hypothetical protein